jgi:hypothetical protein
MMLRASLANTAAAKNMIPLPPIIRPGTFRVAQECGGQSGIFSWRGIGSDWHQGFFKNPSPENILWRRMIGRTLQWLDL